jgi:hypothetical protein
MQYNITVTDVGFVIGLTQTNYKLNVGWKGDDGDSAYDIAVANGFVGSQSAWLLSLIANKFDIVGYAPGYVAADQEVLLIPFARTATFPVNFAGSIARCKVAPTSTFVLTMKKEGVTFGTITFSAGSTTGTFAAASTTSFAVGNVFTIVAQSTFDPTINGIYFNMIT